MPLYKKILPPGFNYPERGPLFHHFPFLLLVWELGPSFRCSPFSSSIFLSACWPLLFVALSTMGTAANTDTTAMTQLNISMIFSSWHSERPPFAGPIPPHSRNPRRLWIRAPETIQNTVFRKRNIWKIEWLVRKWECVCVEGQTVWCIDLNHFWAKSKPMKTAERMTVRSDEKRRKPILLIVRVSEGLVNT